MKYSEIDKIVSDRVQAKKKELLEMSASDLLRIPSESIEEFSVGGKNLVFCVYRDLLESNETLIIVQCKSNRFLGYGRMFAEGLVVDARGDIREAGEQLMWEWV